MITFCGLICALFANAQQTTTIPTLKLSPVSPDAAALGKYGDMPVGLHTGTVKVDVPLYTIRLKDLSIPIGLSYHASGIKVNDLASNVGLGWALQAGGVISTSVNGLDDLSGQGWLKSGITVPQREMDFRTSWSIKESFQSDPFYNNMEDWADDVLDSQPDIFYVNCLGQNFKFFFSQDGKIFTIPYKRVKITWNPAAGGFTLIDENDNTYEFYQNETASTRYTFLGRSSAPRNPDDKEVHSYYLTKITTPHNETVTFKYEPETYSFVNQPSETRYILAKDPGYGGLGCQERLPDAKTESRTTIYRGRVSSIESSAGDNVVFEYKQARLDLPGSSALTRVALYYQGGAKVLMDYKLSYSYFNSITTPVNPDNIRLKLLSIEEKGQAPYTFEYEGSWLPPRISTGQDHWGYYNGGWGLTLLPTDPSIGFSSGATRTPSESAAKYGILKKVIYPTGGSTTFEYELNDYVRDELDYITHEVASNESQPNKYVRETFTVKKNSGPFYMMYSAPRGLVPDPNEVGTYYSCSVKLVDVTNNKVLQVFFGNSGGPNGYDSIRYPTILPPGEYAIDIETDGPYAEGYLMIMWNRRLDTPVVRKITEQTGGLRIKRIINEDALGNRSAKWYTYKKNGTDISSGRVAAAPEYSYIYYNGIVFQESLLDCKYNVQSSQSLAPLGVNAGYSTIYPEVQEFYEDKEQSGYTNNGFSYEGGLSSLWTYPFAPIVAYDWVDGLPLVKEDFSYNPATRQYQLVKKVINEYKTRFGYGSDPLENAVLGAKVALLEPPIGDAGSGKSRDPRFGVSFYTLYSSWSYLTKTTEINYSQKDVSKSVTTETAYYYDNPAHTEVTRKTINKSNGEKYLFQFRYPKDYNPAYPYNASPLVEKRVLIGNDVNTGRLTNSQITLYKNQIGQLPLAIYSSNNTGAVSAATIPPYTGGVVSDKFDKRVEYIYNNDRNVTDIINSSSETTAYLWDYLHAYVVAEVKNASSADIAYTGFEADGKGNWDFSLTGLTTQSAVTGNKCYDLSKGAISGNGLKTTTTYIVSYWKWNAGPVNISGTIGGYPVKGRTYNGWTYYEHQVTGVGTISISGTGYIDELRLMPKGASMVTFSYDPLVGMTNQCDARNAITYYEYDDTGRLKLVRDMDGKIIKQLDYQYKAPITQ